MNDKYLDALESMKLLPYGFKKYGYIVLILSIPIGLGFFWLIKTLFIIETPELFWSAWGLTILHYPIAIGLSLVAFSKEKLEDEMVQALRFKSFVYGVYIFTVAILAFPFLSNLGNLVLGRPFQLKDLGGQPAVLNLLLVCIVAVFRVRMLMEKNRA